MAPPSKFSKNINVHRNIFPKKYKATENFDFERLSINTNLGNINIDLWDTAGQENYGGKLRDAYLKGADGVLLLYDMTSDNSKTNINKWIDQIKKNCNNPIISVLANKYDKIIDFNESFILNDNYLQKLYGSRNIKHFTISIKEDINIKIDSGFTFFSNNTKIKEEKNCLICLEFLLNNLLNTTLNII